MLKIHIPVYVEMLVWRSLKHTQASVTTWLLLLLLLLCMIIAEASLSLLPCLGACLSPTEWGGLSGAKKSAHEPLRETAFSKGGICQKKYV